MLKKYLKISFLILLILFMNIYEELDKYSHNYIIDNIYMNDINNNEVDYLGYIEIERLNIKREIVLGINELNLISHVTLDDRCINLDCDNIILAGHAINNIFSNLKYIKKEDLIKIITTDNINYYKVQSINIVDKENIDVIDNSNLILITCYNLNKRIIVKAKRI